ncbi:MAG: sigma-54-dependent transcriptional regulator [Treponemataceae bacterium]
MKCTILVIDDEKNIREGLRDILELEGYIVFLATDGKEGLRILDEKDIDLVITDLRMPNIGGEEVLKKISSQTPALPVIVLTGHGSVDDAVEAMRSGAYDFLTKPLNLNRLLLVVQRALQTRELTLSHRELLNELSNQKSFESIIGNSNEMRRIFEVVRRVADSKASILITGESGVGKELIANALHNLSSRKNNPIVKVHCAALSESLLESELFGHEKGSFTGAIGKKRGRFEIANGGSIFLDEIGEINQNVQIKILRVLQEKKFERVGGEETIEVDVRVIAATNRNLEKEIANGNFREDLFYRLNVVQIHVPPLRDHKDDIPILAASFLQEFAKENNKDIASFDAQSRSALYKYDWPGNIRQLRNCIESAVIMSTGKTITLDDLPPEIAKKASLDGSIQIPIGITLEQAEKIIIEQNLASLKGNKSKTADVLNIGRKTLHRKLEEYASQK